MRGRFREVEVLGRSIHDVIAFAIREPHKLVDDEWSVLGPARQVNAALEDIRYVAIDALEFAFRRLRHFHEHAVVLSREIIVQRGSMARHFD